MDYTGVLMLAITAAGNATVALAEMSPVLKVLTLLLVIFNINLRLHPQHLAPPPSGPNGEQVAPANVPNLNWPSRDLWKWLGMATSSHLAYFVLKSYAPALWLTFKSQPVDNQLLWEAAVAAIGAYSATGYFYSIYLS